MGDFVTRTRTQQFKRYLFASAATVGSLMIADPATAAAAAAARGAARSAAWRIRPDRHHRYPPYRPHGRQLGLADRRHRVAGADQPAERQPARHGQEHRPVILRPAEQHFGRIDLRSRALAARASGRRSAGPDQRQALQPLGAGPGLCRRRHRPRLRLAGRGHLRDPLDRHQEPPGAARWRNRAIWLGRDRRRHEFRHAERPQQSRAAGALRPVLRPWPHQAR